MAGKRLNPLENPIKVKALNQGVVHPTAAEGINVEEPGGPTKYNPHSSGKGPKGSRGGKSAAKVKSMDDREYR